MRAEITKFAVGGIFELNRELRCSSHHRRIG
jgi:hypothetical protein